MILSSSYIFFSFKKLILNTIIEEKKILKSVNLVLLLTIFASRYFYINIRCFFHIYIRKNVVNNNK